MLDIREELERLKSTPRVWNNYNAENVTPGLIELCEEWIHPNMVMAEVGCFRGVSTSVFACFAHTVFAVDPWTLGISQGYGEIPADMMRKAEDEFLEVCRKFSNIRRIKGFSVEAAQDFHPQILHAVYLDGAHSKEAISQDVRAWLPKIKPGGLLMGHDAGLVPFGDLGLPSVTKTYSESSWVIKL